MHEEGPGRLTAIEAIVELIVGSAVAAVDARFYSPSCVRSAYSIVT
jgi:hypothetical protein